MEGLRALMEIAANGTNMEGGGIRYLAYGSNMCNDVFKGMRAMQSTKATGAVLHNWDLFFPGPFAASIRPKPNASVHGVLYEGLQMSDFVRLWLSEGAGSLYDLKIVHATPYGDDANATGYVAAVTLVDKPTNPFRPKQPEGLASGWYLSYLKRGAKEKNLTMEWQLMLRKLPTIEERALAGAIELFQGF